MVERRGIGRIPLRSAQGRTDLKTTRLDFANRFHTEPLDLPWWSAVLEIGGTKLHVAGFCSSWMSCSDEDKGRLLLGCWQMHALLARADDTALSIALMHHPWDYLADFDAEVVREAVQRRCAIVLSGHRHRQVGQAATRPGGGVLELAAGCCYGGSDYANAYQFQCLPVLGDRPRRLASPGSPPHLGRA